jgi:hypothetical protein
MATRVSRDNPTNLWKELVSREDEEGEIPLPAVDSIILDGDGVPAIVLLAPDTVPGAVNVFMRTEAMETGDRLMLEVFLAGLQTLLRQAGKATGALRSVWHSGGLDYEFHLGGQVVGKEVIQLSDLPRDARPVAWSLLRAIAYLGARYPDLEAGPAKTFSSSPE